MSEDAGFLFSFSLLLLLSFSLLLYCFRFSSLVLPDEVLTGEPFDAITSGCMGFFAGAAAIVTEGGRVGFETAVAAGVTATKEKLGENLWLFRLGKREELPFWEV